MTLCCCLQVPTEHKAQSGGGRNLQRNPAVNFQKLSALTGAREVLLSCPRQLPRLETFSQFGSRGVLVALRAGASTCISPASSGHVSSDLGKGHMDHTTHWTRKGCSPGSIRIGAPWATNATTAAELKHSDCYAAADCCSVRVWPEQISGSRPTHALAMMWCAYCAGGTFQGMANNSHFVMKKQLVEPLCAHCRKTGRLHNDHEDPCPRQLCIIHMSPYAAIQP